LRQERRHHHERHRRRRRRRRTRKHDGLRHRRRARRGRRTAAESQGDVKAARVDASRLVHPALDHAFEGGPMKCLSAKGAAGAGARSLSRSTTSESAERSRTGTCFALTEQVSEETGPARLVLVRSARELEASGDARYQRSSRASARVAGRPLLRFVRCGSELHLERVATDCSFSARSGGEVRRARV
jgi:hypothetical protein